jgi:hypothetical protein
MMQESRGKKRVREHIIADLSINHVQRSIGLTVATNHDEQESFV